MIFGAELSSDVNGVLILSSDFPLDCHEKVLLVLVNVKN